MSSTARLNDFKYTPEDVQLLYGYNIALNTLCDEAAIQHCARMQEKTKSAVVFNSGDYYFEHRLEMPKVVAKVEPFELRLIHH